MVITLDNAVEQLLTDTVIDLGYVYSWRSTKYWVVQKDIVVRLSEQYDNARIVIPKGFPTDLSSVPRGLWSLYAPYGDFLLAALIHDFLYVQNIGTRARADKEMLLWSNITNPKHPINNYVRYLAVRIGGKSWWNKSKLNPTLRLLDLPAEALSLQQTTTSW